MTESSESNLTISIVNHNSVNELLHCLKSVFNNLNFMSCEIFVIDNKCEEQAYQILTHEYPTVNIIKNFSTLGFSANHNQVLRCAKTEYVLVLNPDTFLSKDSLFHMKVFMDNNPTVGVCGPKLIDIHGNWEPPIKRILSPFRDAILNSLYISNSNPETGKSLKRIFGYVKNRKFIRRSSMYSSTEQLDTNKALSCSVISGACMFFRSRALHEVGLFDERFFLYKEENDWCLRAKQKGWQIYYLPQITVLHSVGVSTHKQYHKYLNIFIQSSISFYNKHSGPIIANFLRCTLTLIGLINILRWSLLISFSPKRNNWCSSWIIFTRNLLVDLWKR